MCRLKTTIDQPQTTSRPLKPSQNTRSILADTTTASAINEIMNPLEHCYNALNLTGSWRLDHNGSNLKPGGPDSHKSYACDFREDMRGKWFRIADDGGNQILNKCPLPNSCGSDSPYYTDEKMPERVGERLETYLHTSHSRPCKMDRSVPISVIRCSNKPGDFVYMHSTVYGLCTAAFCGMYATDN